MARYVRDKQIQDLRISEDSLKQIYEIFEARLQEFKTTVSQASAEPADALNCIIRIDEMGVRVFSLEELFSYFRAGKKVERVIFNLETAQSRSTNRTEGTFAELRLDIGESPWFLQVASDNKNWADASFSALTQKLDEFKSATWWIRTQWTALLIQICGVACAFLVSLIAAEPISRHLAVQNAFVFSFFFCLLIISNLWTYVAPQIIRARNKAFPQIRFVRQGKDAFAWLWQAIVATAMLALIGFVLSRAAELIQQMLAGILK